MRRMVGDFVNIVRELSLDELRDQALLAPSLLVVGERAARERVARALFGAEGSSYVTLADRVPAGASDARHDLVLLLWTGSGEAELRADLAAARGRGWPVLVAGVAGSPPEHVVSSSAVVPLPTAGGDWAAARTRLVAAMDEDRYTAVGRHLPALRTAVSGVLIETTARANAQFAALSSLPSLIPFLGNLAGAAGDLLVLTKNQLLLLYKLAALYGRDVDERRQVYLEMAPVVGAALVWRTVARQLVALVPSFLGAVPKIAIAYSGTVVVGRAAQYYYEEGRRPTRAEWDRLYRQAVDRLGTLRGTARRVGEPGARGRATETGVRVVTIDQDEGSLVH